MCKYLVYIIIYKHTLLYKYVCIYMWVCLCNIYIYIYTYLSVFACVYVSYNNDCCKMCFIFNNVLNSWSKRICSNTYEYVTKTCVTNCLSLRYSSLSLSLSFSLCVFLSLSLLTHTLTQTYMNIMSFNLFEINSARYLW